jgi:UDP-glucose 4-epimerase
MAMANILITGMAGGLATLVAARLAREYSIYGLDFRDYPTAWPFPGQFFKLAYTKRQVADLFRQYQFAAVIHLGRLGNPQASFAKRYHFNVVGTENILKLCEKHHVPKSLVLSTFHVYGAHPHNHIHITEDNPLRASLTFPEIDDAVELDNLSTSYLWRNRESKTVVLRPCNIIGPHINNTLARFLRNRYVPYLMGFDPMQQYIHEEDMADAIVAALKSDCHGVYNVIGAGAVPYQTAISLAGGIGVPVPHLIAYPFVDFLSRFGLAFPAHLMDYLRYPTIMLDKKFREESGFQPHYGISQTFQSIHQGRPLEVGR